MTTSPEVLKIIKDLNKKFGEGTVVPGKDITADMMPRVTTGSVTLDYALGGGFPANQWNELIGEPSHGKTGLALQCIAANQALDPDYTTVWVAAETWVAQYAEMSGVDLERVIVVETNIMEEAYDAVIAFAESKSIDAIVIDSLPSLVPSAEDEKDMGEFTVGRGAMLTNKFFRKVGAAMKRSLIEDERPVLGLLINQYRMKIGVMHGDPRTTPGGQGKDYAYFTRCEVRRKEWIEIGPSGNKTRIGQQTGVRVIKNKSAPPQRVAYYDYYFDEGGPVGPGMLDFAKEIVSLCILKDILQRKGAWYSYKDQQWQGVEAVLAAVREDVDLKEELQALALAHNDMPMPQ